MGRHPALLERFGTPEAVTQALDAYFTHQDTEERPYTFSGICRALGFDSAPTLWRYATSDDGSERGEFRQAIKAALVRVDERYEEQLATGKPVGGIFGLKNRGWTDQTQVTHELAGDGWGELLAGLTASTVENGGDSE